jgi:muconolactone delta-isomerase
MSNVRTRLAASKPTVRPTATADVERDVKSEIECKTPRRRRMEFLVEFIVEVPPGTRESEVDARWREEGVAARKLADDGHLIRLWTREIAPPKKSAVGIYVADTREQLDGLMKGLPLYDWMQIRVTDLLPHPNDP